MKISKQERKQALKELAEDKIREDSVIVTPAKKDKNGDLVFGKSKILRRP